MHVNVPHLHFKEHEKSMRDRFIMRVLLPPFLLLTVIGGLAIWQINSFLSEQAVEDLRVASSATAVRLEREIAIRETVLRNTGEEITSIKNAYATNLNLLEEDRRGCRRFYNRTQQFINSPRGYCDPFIGAVEPSLQRIEDVYIAKAKQLQSIEIRDINERLAAFKQFFPETIAVMIIDDTSEIVSTAITGSTTLTADQLLGFAEEALSEPVQGYVISADPLDLGVFAFPIPGGSVLAAYDVDNENYIYPSWQTTPIDTNEAATIVMEKNSTVVYPALRNEIEFVSQTQMLEAGTSATVSLDSVRNVVVSEAVGNSDWRILVASPEALVLSPVRDAQFAVFIIAGLLIVGFLWLGTFFIKRTTDNIARLVTGAMVYGSGRLDYKLDINESEKEFRQLADTMNYMAKRIAENEKEMDERNKEFISIATHELRAPMTSIIGYLEMYRDKKKKLSKQDALLLDSAYDGTLKLRDLITDMLDAARLEGGREEFSIQKLKLKDYVEACLDTMKIVANEGSVKIEYDTKNAGDVMADEGKLRIILNNFVSNAIKYNKKNGHVKVSHAKKDGKIITAIANSGPGIPKDQREHMFEKFFRVDTPEHRKVTGTGIGMFVTKQYILAMQGDVWFESEPGKDTVFYFSLPEPGSKVAPASDMKLKPKPSNSRWIMRWRKHVQ